METEGELNSSKSIENTIELTEENVTKRLCWHLLWKKGYSVVTHQFSNHFWIADIFGINKSNYSHEIEIKVSKADLMSEIKDIEYLINGWTWLPQWRWSKYIKHHWYLNEVKTDSKDKQSREHLIPNYFSFAVPTELVRFAWEKLKDSPYGLIEVYTIWKHIRIWSVFKQAKRIHSNKISFELLLKIARRMSYINEKNINS